MQIRIIWIVYAAPPERWKHFSKAEPMEGKFNNFFFVYAGNCRTWRKKLFHVSFFFRQLKSWGSARVVKEIFICMQGWLWKIDEKTWNFRFEELFRIKRFVTTFNVVTIKRVTIKSTFSILSRTVNLAPSAFVSLSIKKSKKKQQTLPLLFCVIFPCLELFSFVLTKSAIKMLSVRVELFGK